MIKYAWLVEVNRAISWVVAQLQHVIEMIAWLLVWSGLEDSIAFEGNTLEMENDISWVPGVKCNLLSLFWIQIICSQKMGTIFQ